MVRSLLIAVFCDLLFISFFCFLLFFFFISFSLSHTLSISLSPSLSLSLSLSISLCVSYITVWPRRRRNSRQGGQMHAPLEWPPCPQLARVCMAPSILVASQTLVYFQAPAIRTGGKKEVEHKCLIDAKGFDRRCNSLRSFCNKPITSPDMAKLKVAFLWLVNVTFSHNTFSDTGRAIQRSRSCFDGVPIM